MPSNIRVFLDVTIGTKTGGRIIFELFNDVSPMAVENFRGLCTGEYGCSKTSGLPLSYKGCRFFKVSPGFAIQSGDFEYNNGSGGESVYGGTFKDESFLRRHTQAGVLSMANKGRHTNSSQFLITLRKAPQLDGKHVAFGQIVQGMEVVRAIEKCPIDASNVPRVPIQIVDCGELPKIPAIRRSDPKVQMRESINTLMSTLEHSPFDTVACEKQKKKKTEPEIDAEKIQMALVEAKRGEMQLEPSARTTSITSLGSEPLNKQLGSEYEMPLVGKPQEGQGSQSNELEGQQGSQFEEVLDLQDQRQNKLYQLRLGLNQSRKLNAKEVAEEAQEHRQADPKMKHLVHKRKLKEMLNEFDAIALRDMEKRDQSSGESSGDDNDDTKQREKRNRSKQQYLMDRRYLNQTAETIQWKDNQQKKKRSNAEKAFGWNALNTDSHYRAHKKRTGNLKLDTSAYAAQMLQLGEHFYDPTSALVSAEFQPTEEAKERLAGEVEKQGQQRKAFSRRRMHIEDENVGYVNEYNRSFNKKLERAYGAQALEIRQNLERGTAL